MTASHTCIDPTDASGEAVLDVEFKITSDGCAAQTYGPAENCYPAEPPEFEITSAVDENGLERLHALTTDQHQAVEEEIAANFNFRQHARNERDAWSDA